MTYILRDITFQITFRDNCYTPCNTHEETIVLFTLEIYIYILYIYTYTNPIHVHMPDTTFQNIRLFDMEISFSSIIIMNA